MEAGDDQTRPNFATLERNAYGQKRLGLQFLSDGQVLPASTHVGHACVAFLHQRFAGWRPLFNEPTAC
ncbi:hypothetical protein D3C85_709330 [compost metagenome]